MSGLQVVYRISSPIQGNLGEYATQQQAESSAGNMANRLGISITITEVTKTPAIRFGFPYTKETSVWKADISPAMVRV